MIRRLLAALTGVLFLSTMAAGGPAAGADAGTGCGDQLAQLYRDVLGVPVTGVKAEKERAGLVKIVQDATALVDAGKPADAVVKLTNLQTKVDELNAAGRIAPESAALLSSDIAAATQCLASV